MAEVSILSVTDTNVITIGRIYTTGSSVRSELTNQFFKTIEDFEGLKELNDSNTEVSHIVALTKEERIYKLSVRYIKSLEFRDHLTLKSVEV